MNILSENLKGSDHVGISGADGRITSKQILHEQCQKARNIQRTPNSAQRRASVDVNIWVSRNASRRL
jgi:hypothetical protein